MQFGVTGEISRDRLAQPGLITWQGLGGCAVYLSLALARLGASVTFATVAGDDLDPAWLAPLREAGVDLRLRTLAGPTARLSLGYDQNGDIANLRFDAGVESQLDVSHLAVDFWMADWIVIGTAPRSYQAAVVMRASGLGWPVALSTQREFQGDWDGLAALLPYLDILFANSGEVTGLRGDALPIGMDSLRAGNPALTCVVTCGKRGAFLLHEGRLHHVPACPGNVVNTTGAGDAFNAAWLLCFARTADPAYALKVASAAASLALRGPAHTALPWWDEVRGHLEAHARYLTVESWPFESETAQTALAAEDMHCQHALERQVVRK